MRWSAGSTESTESTDEGGDNHHTHSTQCAAEEDKREQRCRGRRGESNRSSLLKRVSAFCVQKSPETCHAEQKEVRQIIRPRTPSPLRHWPGRGQSLHSPPPDTSAERAVIYCSLIARLLWSSLLCSALLCTPLCSSALNCAALAGDPMPSAPQGQRRLSK
jgi:hypothetical protein